jgi:hypothetical protein
MLPSAYSEIATGSSNSLRSANESLSPGLIRLTCRISRRVGANAPPTGTGESLTFRITPRHYHFLSVGEEFGADAPLSANATMGRNKPEGRRAFAWASPLTFDQQQIAWAARSLPATAILSWDLFTVGWRLPARELKDHPYAHNRPWSIIYV